MDRNLGFFFACSNRYFPDKGKSWIENLNNYGIVLIGQPALPSEGIMFNLHWGKVKNKHSSAPIMTGSNNYELKTSLKRIYLNIVHIKSAHI